MLLVLAACLAFWASLALGVKQALAAEITTWTYTLSPAPHASYPDTGGVELTDGVQPDSCASWGCAFLWDNADGQIRIDMGAATSVGIMELRGYYGAAGIYMPVGYKLERSSDNSSWTTVSDAQGLPGQGQPGDRPFRYYFAGDSTAARYWRITLTRGGQHTAPYELNIYEASPPPDAPEAMHVIVDECDSCGGGGAGGEVSLSASDRERLDLGWWGAWATVGLLLVLLFAQKWHGAWRFMRE